MCDGWTNGINHMHIMNFLVHCSRGTVFIKSIDASNVASRNTEYYFNLLDKMVEEVGEEYVVQIVTDNEAALKAAGLNLMKKYTNGKEIIRPAITRFANSFCNLNQLLKRNKL
ncbi:hypothetical protein P8452_66264 [Trifolium repens]|nr:hypothetical protein P8452_66264 [Trifolium repens]